MKLYRCSGGRLAEPFLERAGKRVLLLGNEAIARGLLEAGLDACAAYPGTPSTEIMETLIAARKSCGHYAEWSTNEKVAAEVAISAAMCGLRASVSMKGVGVNVASEPMQAFTYMGTVGGLVLITADDPSMNSSHNEQDNRFFAREAYLPVFEPSDSSEAREVARRALLLSEEWHQPVVLRSTTVIGHSSAPVTLGELPVRDRRGAFPRDPARWTNLPQNARRMRGELLERFSAIRRAVEELEFNSESGSGDVGLIGSGAAFPVLAESLEALGVAGKVRLFKLGTPFPLPEKRLGAFLERCSRVLVVEELEPFVEEQVQALAHRMGPGARVEGKSRIPITGELTVGRVLPGVAAFLDGRRPPEAPAPALSPEQAAEAERLALPRPPVLCAGCLHRSAFFAINLSEKGPGKSERMLRPSDIGCYTLGYQPPLNAVDTNFCMGAGIGIACGLGRFSGDRVVPQIGDSTFFHAGIPPLMNAVVNGSDVVLLLLDNGTTAMTGHQPHPGVGRRASGEPAARLDLERMVRACGVEHVQAVPGWDIGAISKAIDEGAGRRGVTVVIVRERCVLTVLRDRRASGRTGPVCSVEPERCIGCLSCITRFGCPAMRPDGKKMRIDAESCVGCGACLDPAVCAEGAITGRKGGLEG
ncbi:MAG: indolepyruvate ferredoxin oxidoreductase subunit alpha [Euryarchaeota archaeon]|nr:indolepyruvate ferredoxin oxidoreductase subunit alpha [Euryarchaeota archaeon]